VRLSLKGRGGGGTTVLRKDEELLQFLYYMAITVGAITLIGAPVMKCFAWRIPFLVHALVFFVATYIVYFIWTIVHVIGNKFKIYPTPNSAYYVLIGMIPAAGWLITRILAKWYGTPTKFPAIGARVMIVVVPLVYLIVAGVTRIFGGLQ
jgi:hypothetical protein